MRRPGTESCAEFGPRRNRAASNTVLPGETILTFEMVDIAGMSTTAPTAPGSYTVPIESSWAAQTAWLRTNSVDAHCTLSGTGDARSGTVDVGSKPVC